MSTQSTQKSTLDFAALAARIIEESSWPSSVPEVPAFTFNHRLALKDALLRHGKLGAVCLVALFVALATLALSPTGSWGGRVLCTAAVLTAGRITLLLAVRVGAHWKYLLARFRGQLTSLGRCRSDCQKVVEWAAEVVIVAIIEGIHTEACSAMHELKGYRGSGFPSAYNVVGPACGTHASLEVVGQEAHDVFSKDVSRYHAEVSVLVAIAKAFSEPLGYHSHLVSILERHVPDQARTHPQFMAVISRLTEIAAMRQEAREAEHREMEARYAEQRREQQEAERKRQAERDAQYAHARNLEDYMWQSTRKRLLKNLDREIARLEGLLKIARARGGSRQADELQEAIDSLLTQRNAL